MTAKPPPVPPENRSHKGKGSDPVPGVSDTAEKAERQNLDSQGRYANTKQNTTSQGNHGKRAR
jgi:hypothetical protein